VLPCGDAAVSVEFCRVVSTELNEILLAFDIALHEARTVGILETVPTYRGLLVRYKPMVLTYDAVNPRGGAAEGTPLQRPSEFRPRAVVRHVCVDGMTIEGHGDCRDRRNSSGGHWPPACKKKAASGPGHGQLGP
jgi:hypothetical protein